MVRPQMNTVEHGWKTVVGFSGLDLYHELATTESDVLITVIGRKSAFDA
jgi:hypothetical protein